MMQQEKAGFIFLRTKDETKQRFEEVDMEVESGGRIVHTNQRRVTCVGVK